MDALISTSALDEQRNDPFLIIFDASFYLPTETQSAADLFLATHIPGAVFLDIDMISDRISTLPHMVPPAAEFATMVEALGVSDQSRIVIYDQRGLFSAARAWWLFTLFGHDAVQVLNGGLPKWCAEGRATASGAANPRPAGQFTPHLRAELIRDRTAIELNLRTQTEIVLDARAAGRFSGAVAEPRPGMRGGHIPGAVSLPFTELLCTDGTMLSEDALRHLFAARGISSESRPITMCGSGVTGAVLSLGLVCAGLPIGSLYDGSWAEWGGAPDTLIERTA